jgi:hypothetical protein
MAWPSGFYRRPPGRIAATTGVAIDNEIGGPGRLGHLLFDSPRRQRGISTSPVGMQAPRAACG